ncbi:hypothetical protein [Wenjunlia vitaminophila]|uniref:hypothetical protein n=1 Tax=Wenjunlia vitaminophila TaxID=76728 RepID=UPI0003A65A72
MRSSEPLRPSTSDQSADPGDGFAGTGTTDEDMWEIFRVVCPDCRQPIALLADEEVLPEHALCPTPWNPFGLSVCRGSGRPVEDAGPVVDVLDTEDEHVAAALLTLPEGLDWRTQPFSHASGAVCRPIRVPRHG